MYPVQVYYGIFQIFQLISGNVVACEQLCLIPGRKFFLIIWLADISEIWMNE